MAWWQWIIAWCAVSIAVAPIAGWWLNYCRLRLMAEQDKCDAWNKAHGIGTAVKVWRDFGPPTTGFTNGMAYVLSGHTAVIHVTGISGCYALERVEALCSDCPPVGHSTDKTRCDECPRRG